MKKYNNFWHDVEQQNEYIPYGDTDSIFIVLKNHKNIENNIDAVISEVNDITTDINKNIIDKYNTHILNKCGSDKKYNNVFFKTEYISSAFLQLDVKKNYILKTIVKEGVVFKTPKLAFTGISSKKSNSSEFSRQLINELIDWVFSNPIKSDILIDLDKIFNKYQKKYNNCINTLDMNYISLPSKWGMKTIYAKEPTYIIGMRTYNTLTKTKTFQNSTYGMSFPIKIENMFLFDDFIKKTRHENIFCLQNINVKNIKYLTIPYNYNVDIVSKLFSQYAISIDRDKLWDILINKTIKRIVQTIKNTQ